MDDAPVGEVLVRERETLSDLIYLHDGAADVLFDGSLVGRCGAGDLIGDATVLHGSPATGTVRLISPSNLWRIGADQLRRARELRPDLRPVLERQINLVADLEARRGQPAGERYIPGIGLGTRVLRAGCGRQRIIERRGTDHRPA